MNELRSRRPWAWGQDVEEYYRRERRREAVRTVLVALGMVAGAAAVLVVGWLACVGFLVTFR